MAKQILDWYMPGHVGIFPSNVAILNASDPDELTPHWPTDCKSISLTKDMQNSWAGKERPLENRRSFNGLEADAIVFAGMSENLLKIS